MKRRGFLGYSLLFLVGCTASTTQSQNSSQPGSGNQPETLRLAVTDVQGLEELQRDYGAFQKELEATLGRKIEFFPVADRAAAAVALQSDQVDIVFTGPAEYVVINAKTQAVPFLAITRPNYFSVIAVRADSGITTAEQLKGLQLSMSDIGSTSGHLGPAKILVDQGLNPQNDLEVLMLGDAELQALKNADVKAWGGSYIDYERFLEAEGAQESDYPILFRGETLPSDVLIASKNIAPSLVEEMTEKMLANEAALIAAITSVDANEKFVGSELVAVEDGDYDSVREAYRAIGVNEFTEFVGE
ncbi:phosphate/phosphite/phosphonate ABC transporter substrate-binding protein [Leptolyngbya sp. CCNP1308]|uniref:phosphate/phosphite/phosphonate ABC transporter substrate-binding protein n=1 Tax=Leptolyngbya sp. CCNP1308 TaxID=3110255 RepID=UPI002B208486|nr:phosphate/phosphite/phosphonate ABC transporter substrate-binding protein [Leptolyngbya sp. CCNP1308]MEA5452841.1 phosphate/phosphite/phosphonate ABC transporter substrate-binding protein [Leptolyngbya sp. CCNP1308]